MVKRHMTHRRVRILIGLVLLTGFAIQVRWALKPSGDTTSVVVHVPTTPGPGQAVAATVVDFKASTNLTLEQRAAVDPLAFLEFCLERYDRSVRDYTATFTKQELVGRRLTEVQVMNASCREKPFSVRLEWTRNADKCDAVLYVEGQWKGENGEDMAVVVPGVIARMFVSHVMRDIHGKDAERSSRRTVDQFGLRSMLTLVLEYCHKAKATNQLELSYLGNGEVNGRDTLVFERRLPYTGPAGEWPDRILTVHIDKELLVPTLCVAHADDKKSELLGSYMMTDIALNVNLDDQVFTKKGMGLE